MPIINTAVALGALAAIGMLGGMQVLGKDVFMGHKQKAVCNRVL